MIKTKLIVGLVLVTTVVGCAGFNDIAVKSMNVTKSTLDTTSQAFVSAVETMFKAGLLDSSDKPALIAIALAYDDAYNLWRVATEAYFAGQQKTFLNTAACLLVSLQDILSGLKQAGILIDTHLLEAATAVGQSLVAEYGGECVP